MKNEIHSRLSRQNLLVVDGKIRRDEPPKLGNKLRLDFDKMSNSAPSLDHCCIECILPYNDKLENQRNKNGAFYKRSVIDSVITKVDYTTATRVNFICKSHNVSQVSSLLLLAVS